VSADQISTHIDTVLARQKEVFNYFVENIYNAMVVDDSCNPDNRRMIGEVSQEVAEVFGVDKQDAYSLLSSLFEGFPGLTKKMGPTGGLYRVSTQFVGKTPEKKAEDTAAKVEKLQKQLAKQTAKLAKLKG
jgi:hypothetical protein